MSQLIVDGYNVVHAWPPLKRLMSTASLEAARDELDGPMVQTMRVRRTTLTGSG